MPSNLASAAHTPASCKWPTLMAMSKPCRKTPTPKCGVMPAPAQPVLQHRRRDPRLALGSPSSLACSGRPIYRPLPIARRPCQLPRLRPKFRSAAFRPRVRWQSGAIGALPSFLRRELCGNVAMWRWRWCCPVCGHPCRRTLGSFPPRCLIRAPALPLARAAFRARRPLRGQTPIHMVNGAGSLRSTGGHS